MFFQNAVKPEWTTQREGVVNLPKDSAKTVVDYIKWLYSDRMSIELYTSGGGTIEENAAEAEKVFVLLAEAYVFGEMIVDIKYKNAVMETVVAARAASGWNMGPESVTIAYEGTPPASPLRRFIAESIAHKAHLNSKDSIGWAQFIEEYPRDVLVDAMKAMVKVRPAVSESCPLVDSYLEKL